MYDHRLASYRHNGRATRPARSGRHRARCAEGAGTSQRRTDEPQQQPAERRDRHEAATAGHDRESYQAASPNSFVFCYARMHRSSLSSPRIVQETRSYVSGAPMLSMVDSGCVSFVARSLWFHRVAPNAIQPHARPGGRRHTAPDPPFPAKHGPNEPDSILTHQTPNAPH